VTATHTLDTRANPAVSLRPLTEALQLVDASPQAVADWCDGFARRVRAHHPQTLFAYALLLGRAGCSREEVGELTGLLALALLRDRSAVTRWFEGACAEWTDRALEGRL
jgi:hypothetical protein